MKDTYKYLSLIDNSSLELYVLEATKVHENATIKVLNCLCPLFGIKFENDDKIIHVFDGKNVEYVLIELHSSEFDTLTRDNCIQIQLLLEEVSRECLKYLSRDVTLLYDFIDNFVQLRIAVALYSNKTWYNIRRFRMEGRSLQYW